MPQMFKYLQNGPRYGFLAPPAPPIDVRGCSGSHSAFFGDLSPLSLALRQSKMAAKLRIAIIKPKVFNLET